MRLNSKQIAFYTGGTFLIEPIDPSFVIKGITWDSRDVKPGMLFVAIPGDKVDGHAFVEQAVRSGAKAVLVNEAPDGQACLLAQEMGAAIIEVPNTMHAIADLAREWRGHLKGKVIAVTGSVGKTTTKNLIADVARAKYRVKATVGNQNNELGCPKTVLDADPEDSVVVVEMGMDAAGDIAKLCDIARPAWGAITLIGDNHMEFLGSKDAIANAKGELFEALPTGVGMAFVNADDPYAEDLILQGRLKQRCIDYALFASKQEDVRDLLDRLGNPEHYKAVWAEDIALDAEGFADFDLCAKGFAAQTTDPSSPTLFDMEPDIWRSHVKLGIRGEQNVGDAACACACGLALGIPMEDIASALESSVAEAGRLQAIEAPDGSTIINDAYNASPDSMRASLSMLSKMQARGRKIAVLGDMGELGPVEVESHKNVGKIAAVSDLDQLICIGELSRNIADSAIDAGMDSDSVLWAASIGQALDALEGRLSVGDVVLVKASHFMGLERLVEGLIS